MGTDIASLRERTFAAHAQYRRVAVLYHREPPRPAIVLMAAELDRALRAAGHKPIALQCRTFLLPEGGDGHNAAARIIVTAIPGEMKRPFKSWFEWQHPRWHDETPLPFVSGREASLLDPGALAQLVGPQP